MFGVAGDALSRNALRRSLDRAPTARFGLPAPGPGWVSRGWGPVPPILLPLHGRAPEHALVGACPLLLHLKQRALPSFGVHADLQVQSSLLEDADAVADSVVAAVLRCAHARPRCADETAADRQPVADFGVEAVAPAAPHRLVAHSPHALAAPQRLGAFMASPTPTKEIPAKCAFFLQDVSELDDPDRCFPLTAEDFARVNPNTGTAPIFRTRRDATLTTAIYNRLPVLVDRSSGKAVKAWPVKYTRMFDMTNDSGLFRTRAKLEGREGAWPVGGNRFGSPSGDWVPLYEGKMVQAFDHRAANIVVNLENQHRPAQPVPATPEQHQNPSWLPDPQFWVSASECGWTAGVEWVLGFKEITAPTNVRTLIAALFPTIGFGNKVPIFKPETTDRSEWLLVANLNATILDFVTRQKVQGQTLNLFIVEQLPVVPLDRYDSVRFGPKTAGEIVREAVLELTYTAHDMAPFARDMGHLDEAGVVKPPFRWDEDRRLGLRAKLDAVFFYLYGVTDRDEVRYIYSTFPIVERQETEAYGRYRSCALCLAWINALAAGHPDAKIE